MQMSITKPELVKYIIPCKSGQKNNGPLSKFGKEFHSCLIVVFSLSTTLGMVSKFAYLTTYGIVIFY